MDDTKKIIEKYKRELMEMSKASGASKSAEQNRVSTKREPQVIGYVSEENKSYDNFLEQISKMPADALRSSSSQTEPENTENTDTFPDDVFDTPPDDEPMDYPDEPPESADDPGQPSDTGAEPSDEIPDMLPDDAPDNAPDDDPDDDPDANSNKGTAEIIDETVEDGQPIFTPPNYAAIPSAEQVRGEITEQSDPAENPPEQNVSGVTDNSAAAPRPESGEVQVTTEEQAERLKRQPVSGTDPNEQLTGRSFEEKPPAPVSDVSMEQGSRSEPANFPRSVFASYEDYQKQNTGKGTIIFRVYTGRQAVPLENAECVIYTRINGSKYEIARLLTNSSGQTPVQELPAPDKELSQHSENTIQAFALYDATVTKKGFSQVVLEDIPVFDTVQSVQRVFMIVNA